MYIVILSCILIFTPIKKIFPHYFLSNSSFLIGLEDFSVYFYFRHMYSLIVLDSSKFSCTFFPVTWKLAIYSWASTILFLLLQCYDKFVIIFYKIYPSAPPLLPFFEKISWLSLASFFLMDFNLIESCQWNPGLSDWKPYIYIFIITPIFLFSAINK